MKSIDIEAFVRAHVTGRHQSLLTEDFAAQRESMHARLDGKRLLVVGGAGTIGSNYIKAALREFAPASLFVVDIDENQLTELTRELRAGDYRVPDEYITEPIDLGSRLFEKFFRAHAPFDVVANFAARKHVRAERDIHSIEAMCETNVFMAKKLLDLLLERPPEHFFCVSTDKAANPVNVMGATKKLMEDTVLAYAARNDAEKGMEGGRSSLKAVMARFANVAFSNGSLPIGWMNRLAKGQPLSCPLGIRRFFVSPVESGELCLFASVMGESGDILYPRLDPEKDLITFDSFLPAFLEKAGFGLKRCASTDEAKVVMAARPADGGVASRFDYPVEFFGSDTDGEKPIEEFYTDNDIRDESAFVRLGAVKNPHRRPVAEVEAVFSALREVFDRPGSTKDDVVRVLSDYLPDFHHIAKGKSLDGRM